MTEVLPRDMQERIQRVTRVSLVMHSSRVLPQLFPPCELLRFQVYEMIIEAEGTNTQPELRQKFRELYTEAMEWVESEISAHTFADFKRSQVSVTAEFGVSQCSSDIQAAMQFYCKMVAYLRWAAPFVKVTLAEILQTPRAQPYLQLYLAQQKRCDACCLRSDCIWIVVC